MIRTKSDLKFYLQEDKKQQPLNNMPWRLGVYIGNEASCIFRVLRALRLYEYAINNRKGLFREIRYQFRKIRYRQLRLKYQILIAPNTVGYGLRIRHLGGGIIINCKQMGNYCGVTSGVVIGNKDNQENRPTIGDNVSFALGCKVFGKITIGNNAIIAPNSVVFKDVPEYGVVSGVPAKLIKMNTPS